ncbi:hypothetical protein Gotur_032479, partial [Gossypium turneri]
EQACKAKELGKGKRKADSEARDSRKSPFSKSFQLTSRKFRDDTSRSKATTGDTSHKGPTQVQERDGLKLPQGPITRSKAGQMRSKLNGTIQEFVSKALDAYTKERENQDSLSCFQENQETESWPNFSDWRDFKNQENHDFKSWKSWSKKPNLAAKA